MFLGNRKVLIYLDIRTLFENNFLWRCLWTAGLTSEAVASVLQLRLQLGNVPWNIEVLLYIRCSQSLESQT